MVLFLLFLLLGLVSPIFGFFFPSSFLLLYMVERLESVFGSVCASFIGDAAGRIYIIGETKIAQFQNTRQTVSIR